MEVVGLVARAAADRLALERRQGKALVEKAGDRAAAEEVERKVIAAWTKWYAEALDSIVHLPAAGGSDLLRARVAAAKESLKSQP